MMKLVRHEAHVTVGTQHQGSGALRTKELR